MTAESAGIPPADALDGLHHVTAVTADPQRNLDFHGGLLGPSPHDLCERWSSPLLPRR